MSLTQLISRQHDNGMWLRQYQRRPSILRQTFFVFCIFYFVFAIWALPGLIPSSRFAGLRLPASGKASLRNNGSVMTNE